MGETDFTFGSNTKFNFMFFDTGSGYFQSCPNGCGYNKGTPDQK